MEISIRVSMKKRRRPGRESPGAAAQPNRPPRAEPGRGQAAVARHLLYGRHAVMAALANPRRTLERLYLTEAADPPIRALMSERRIESETLAREAFEALLPPGAVAQGLALACRPLRQPGLEQILRALKPEEPAFVLALDQVTDPQNVGAILRSAAAFGATAVLTTRDKAPEETGSLAKAASGGLEVVPYLQETNLARSLETLKEAGFWCYGLDEGGQPLAAATAAGAERRVLVLGAEGTGLRRLTRQHCDLILSLPTRPPVTALNVSNAAAVALFALCAGPVSA